MGEVRLGVVLNLYFTYLIKWDYAGVIEKSEEISTMIAMM